MKLLSQIKNDIDFNRNLYNLVDALGKIAVSQYYLLEKKVKLYEKIFTGVGEIFAAVDIVNSSSPFINPQNCPPGVIAVTSDAGLLGGLNMQVMNLAAKEMSRAGGKPEGSGWQPNSQSHRPAGSCLASDSQSHRLLTIGEKGRLYAAENNMACASFKGIGDTESFLQAQQLRDYIIAEGSEGRLGALKIIYPHPISVISQRVQTITLLPVTQVVSSPPRPPAGNREGGNGADVILESSTDNILKYLAYIFLGNKLSDIFSLARLAELSARFVHLETSKSKIEQLNKELRLQYFRQKHELADRNMRELFAARLAFQHGA